jgi:predicted  nucleic acid-binding Zn-ribbon protein
MNITAIIGLGITGVGVVISALTLFLLFRSNLHENALKLGQLGEQFNTIGIQLANINEKLVSMGGEAARQYDILHRRINGIEDKEERLKEEVAHVTERVGKIEAVCEVRHGN